MLAMIGSVSKTRLHHAAQVSIRTIPSSLAAANDLSDKELRRIFVEASAMAGENRNGDEGDAGSCVPTPLPCFHQMRRAQKPGGNFRQPQSEAEDLNGIPYEGKPLEASKG